MSDTLVKLEENWLCACESLPDNELVPCHRRAHWMINNIPVCDADIREIAGLNSDNERFLQPALDDIAERHERRNLFIAVMRKPEMRVLRAALCDLKWERGIDWTTITSLEIIAPTDYSPAWILLTDHHECICLWPDEQYPDFTVWTLHNADDPECECAMCRDARLCHIRVKRCYTDVSA